MADPRQAILAALDADDQRAHNARPYWIERAAEIAPAHAPTSLTGQHIVAHDPETVLRRNAGVRAVVAMHGEYADPGYCSTCEGDGWPCPTIRALADAYTPGWDDAGTGSTGDVTATALPTDAQANQPHRSNQCVAPDCPLTAATGSSYCVSHSIAWGRGTPTSTRRS